jgi:hypothetical protein
MLKKPKPEIRATDVFISTISERGKNESYRNGSE